MPLKKATTNTKSKPKAVRLASLNLPVGGAKPLFVGDAERAKIEDFFDGAFNPKKSSTHFSEPFTILGGETSHYKDKETVVFLIDTGEGENVYVYMGGNEQRNALAKHFMDGGAPVEKCRFHRIDVGQAQPFVAIEDSEEAEGDEPF